MRSIDIRWVNAPPKFAKALADQGSIDKKHEQLMVYYREKNAEEARLVQIHEYRIGRDVKEFEVRL